MTLPPGSDSPALPTFDASTSPTFDPSALPIREALAFEYQRAWQRLAAPGTWWSGADRLAIADETRQAAGCALCRQRKHALSPYTVTGHHSSLEVLSAPVIDVVHRLATDAGRLTRKWLSATLDAGLSEEQYVEVVAVVAVIVALDTFDHSLGRPLRPLPLAQPGEPTRHRPAGAKRDLAWVMTVAPEDLADGDPDPYTIHGSKNIHRALSLVPQEVLNFFDLDVELYLKDHEIRDFDHEYRALSHPQIELLAGRVSALNGCYY
jgi:alkylhydroperoxidase family enzyme